MDETSRQEKIGMARRNASKKTAPEKTPAKIAGNALNLYAAWVKAF